MELNKYLESWKKFVGRMNEKGIPFPTVRDPKTGRGSVSLTLVFVSSLLVIVGIVGKWSDKLGNIDIANAMQFFWTACALYWGRKFQSKDGSSFGDVSGDNEAKEEPKSQSKACQKSECKCKSVKPVITSEIDNPDA